MYISALDPEYKLSLSRSCNWRGGAPVLICSTFCRAGQSSGEGDTRKVKRFMRLMQFPIIKVDRIGHDNAEAYRGGVQEKQSGFWSEQVVPVDGLVSGSSPDDPWPLISTGCSIK